MNYASIRQGRAADDSRNYQRIDHSSETDFAGRRQNICLNFPAAIPWADRPISACPLGILLDRVSIRSPMQWIDVIHCMAAVI